MNDKTLKPEADWHPKIKDVVYHGKQRELK